MKDQKIRHYATENASYVKPKKKPKSIDKLDFNRTMSRLLDDRHKQFEDVKEEYR